MTPPPAPPHSWHDDPGTARSPSDIVTVIGLPLAIFVYLRDQREERKNEDEEVHVRLSDEYSDFLELVLKNADLQLTTRNALAAPPTPEQQERRLVLFEILISLFERAYILVYEDDMDKEETRLWASRHDYMREWCARRDVPRSPARPLTRRRPGFATYIRKISEEEESAARQPAPS